MDEGDGVDPEAPGLKAPASGDREDHEEADVSDDDFLDEGEDETTSGDSGALDLTWWKSSPWTLSWHLNVSPQGLFLNEWSMRLPR